ncbi:MAG: 23S rRNA (uracil(1939)-C(5))-methyltransferase RlmD [Chloroflexota bacterium]
MARLTHTIPAITLDIEELAPSGEGVGQYGDLRVAVLGALLGERVRARVYKHGQTEAFARLLEVLQPAPERVAAPCPCQWQHAGYQHQLRLKREQLLSILELTGLERARLADLVRPVIGMADPWHYRNHARFSVTRDGSLGFTLAHSRRPMRIDACLLMHPFINQVLALLQGRVRGLHQVAVRYGIRTGQFLIQPRVPEIDHLIETGQPQLEEEVLGRRFRISAASFFQVNTRPDPRPLEGVLHRPSPVLRPDGLHSQAEVLSLVVLDRLALHGDEQVIDAYCGVGTFSALLAPFARRVIGIEESHAALQDAQHNTRDLANVRFIEGKTEQVLASFEEPVDAVVLDPARPGCRPEVLDALARLAARGRTPDAVLPSIVAVVAAVLGELGPT